MPPEDLKPWKDQPPQTPDEAEAARHLQALRSMPSLTPEALAQVQRRLRENAGRRESRRLALFAGLRPAVLSGALALLLVVGGLTFVVAEHSRTLLGAATSSLSPSQPQGAAQLAQEEERAPTRSLANFGSPPSKPVPAPLAATPPSALAMREWSQPPPDVERNAEMDERRHEPALRTLGGLGSLKGEASTPEPSRSHAAAKAKKALEPEHLLEKSDDGLGAVASAAAPALSGAGAGGAAADRFAEREAAEAPAGLGRTGRLRSALAPPPPAAPMAQAKLESAGPAAADSAALGSISTNAETPIAAAERLARSGRCPEAVPRFSALLDGGDSPLPVIERALVGRARCYLQLGQSADAQADLQLYLSRFPDGRFTAEARSLLK